MEIKKIYEDLNKLFDQEITVSGWIRNHRKQKDFGFIDFTDGTAFKTVQVVYDKELKEFEEIQKLLVGSSIEITGIISKSEGNQEFEIKATKIVILGTCPEDYPIQPKRHTREFLRENSYLRPRTNLFNAVFKIRSVLAMSIHEYFQSNGYVYIHTPIITSLDCEGAGEMFNITTKDPEEIAKSGKYSAEDDFFGKKVGLTVSGQLAVEPFAMAYSKVYTFGPTFRAENSNTKNHASEFWMIEPELAFCDDQGMMDMEEDMLKFIIKYVFEKASDELNFLDKFVENGLVRRLEAILTADFARITHEEVINMLKEANEKFEFEPKQGEDIAKEHEKYLVNKLGVPVFITNWPKDIKSFYMKQNDDGKTVRGVDLIVPGCGELIGGSQREEDYDKLAKRMDEMNISKEDLDWYLNLRKFGTAVHSGFGLGFERLVMFITGIDNIRDVIAYHRTPGNCEN